MVQEPTRAGAVAGWCEEGRVRCFYLVRISLPNAVSRSR